MYRLITNGGFNNTLLTFRIMMSHLKLRFHSFLISPSKINGSKKLYPYLTADLCGFLRGEGVGGCKGKNELGVDFPQKV